MSPSSSNNCLDCIQTASWHIEEASWRPSERNALFSVTATYSLSARQGL